MCFSQRLHRVFWFHAFWSVSTLTNSMCSADHTRTFRNLTLKLRRTRMQLNQGIRNQSEPVHGRSFVFCPLSSSPHHHRHPAPATDENQLRVPLGALYLNYLRKQGNTSWENVGRCWKMLEDLIWSRSKTAVLLSRGATGPLMQSSSFNTPWYSLTLGFNSLMLMVKRTKKTGSGKNICILYIVLFFSTTSPSKKHQLLKNLTTPHWVDPTVPGEARNGELLNLGISKNCHII
jgi:hypothetical protein